MILLQLLSYILLIIFALTIIKNDIKKSDTFLDKFLLLTFGITTIIPFYIYITDYLNIPTNLKTLGFINSIDLQFWKDFTATYTAAIAGTILSSGMILFITKLQLDRTKDDNQKALKEEARLSNIPYMQYNFKNIELVPEKITTIDILLNEKNNTEVDEIKLTIKNIGMNIAKNCKIELRGKGIDSPTAYPINHQCFLPQNEEMQIIFKIENCTEKNYNYKMIFYYQDLLSNQYMQTIYLTYNLSFNKKSISHENLEIKIENEQLIN